MKKLKTINLSGKQYAQVAERLRAIHEDHKDFDIITKFIETQSGIVFRAKLAIRDKVEGTTQTYVGSSYGKAGAVKAFEKLETIAVGRALAFAGYHADGEIASADEMADYNNSIDESEMIDALDKMESAKSVTDLNKIFKSLPLAIQRSKEAIEVGKRKKKELTTIE